MAANKGRPPFPLNDSNFTNMEEFIDISSQTLYQDDMNKHDFSPAEGVTLQNAIRYVATVGEAIRRDLLKLPLEDRGYIASLLSGALLEEGFEIADFKKELIRTGQAVDMTAQQKEQFELMLRRFAYRTQGS